LIVDLDGSLLRTDTLHEMLAAALTHPRVLAGSALHFATRGKAGLKAYLARHVSLDVSLLPVNERVLEFVQSQADRGRSVYIASGTDASIAAAVADRFPLFAGHYASDGHANLTSRAKADALVAEFGAAGFDYIGNSKHDRAVWEKADRSYLVASGRAPGWSQGIDFAEVLREEGKPTWRLWLKELRVHQSVKSLVMFLPILAAHDFALRSILLLAAGFVTFAAMSSSVYLLNDSLDLQSDRVHATKAHRPLASGRILPLHALAAGVFLAVGSLVSAVLIDLGFAIVLVCYALLTVAYSFWLKRVTLVDVAVLALLYMIRIVAGAVISNTELSFWFTALALFFFISLALVKRYTELTRPSALESDAMLPGRGYSRVDAPVVLMLGVGSGMAVLLLMAIYLQSDAVHLIYPSEGVLWLAIPAMFYWIGNIWIAAGRGAVHDDPIIFALKNKASLAAGAFIVALFVIASTPLASTARDVYSSWTR
jgi:4-hydroxybenzoate polyprenyltransferase